MNLGRRRRATVGRGSGTRWRAADWNVSRSAGYSTVVGVAVAADTGDGAYVGADLGGRLWARPRVLNRQAGVNAELCGGNVREETRRRGCGEAEGMRGVVS